MQLRQVQTVCGERTVGAHLRRQVRGPELLPRGGSKHQIPSDEPLKAVPESIHHPFALAVALVIIFAVALAALTRIVLPPYTPIDFLVMGTAATLVSLAIPRQAASNGARR